jgi:hypothetical protein
MTLSLAVSQQVTIARQSTPAVIGTRPTLYRILHDFELGEVRNVTDTNGAPEIQRLEPFHMTAFSYSWQWLSFGMNPGMTPQKWTSLYGNTTVMTNGQGFGDASDPRRNYITGEDASAELPRVASLLFGGNVVTGRVDGAWLWVETLDCSKPAPSLAYILARRWLYQIGTNVSKSGQVSRLPQGAGQDVLLPIYASKPAKFPLAKLRRLSDDEPIPSPYAG